MNHHFLHAVDPGQLPLPGHLENIKSWLDRLPMQFGTRPPKATLLCGIPGSGKARVAAAIALALQRPLYRLDPACDGVAMAEIVGLLAASDPCVLLVVEPGEQHRGLVQWLIERSASPVFLVAATSRPDKLPAGFFRRDLFDTAWHLDLPNRRERSRIWSQLFDPHGSPVAGYDSVRLSNCSPRFTCEEIIAVHDAVVRSTPAGATPRENAFLDAVGRLVPIASEFDDEVSVLREWSARRTVRAGIRLRTTDFD